MVGKAKPFLFFIGINEFSFQQFQFEIKKQLFNFSPKNKRALNNSVFP